MRKLACILFFLVIWCSYVNAGGRQTDTSRWPDNTIPVALVDPDGRYAGVANALGSYGLFSIGIDFPHYKIHTGNHFVTQAFAELADGEKTQLIINTPALPYYVHFNILQTSSSESYFEVWRSPTLSDIGNSITILNRNDNFADTSGVIITIDSAITNAGTMLDGYGEHIGAGQLKGGQNFGQNEIILQPSTLYFVNTVSEAANNHVDVILPFYIDGGDKR